MYIMGLFDDIKKNFNQAGQDLSNSLNRGSEQVQITLKNNELKSSLEDKYKEIGKKFYEENRENAPEGYADLFKEVDDKTKQLEENNKKMDEIKNKDKKETQTETENK